MDDRLAIGTMKFYRDMVGGLCKAIYERYGEEGLEIIRGVTGKFGAIQAQSLKRQSNSLKGAADVQASTVADVGMKLSVTATENEVVTIVDKCPFDLDNTCRELCDAFMDFDRALWSGIDPRAELDIQKTVAVGDPQCVIIAKIKDEC